MLCLTCVKSLTVQLTARDFIGILQKYQHIIKTQPNLNTLENLIVPYCSLTEQTQIVAILENILTACDQLADELSKQLKQAELLKQAVLKAVFSGSLLDK